MKNKLISTTSNGSGLENFGFGAPTPIPGNQGLVFSSSRNSAPIKEAWPEESSSDQMDENIPIPAPEFNPWMQPTVRPYNNDPADPLSEQYDESTDEERYETIGPAKLNPATPAVLKIPQIKYSSTNYLSAINQLRTLRGSANLDHQEKIQNLETQIEMNGHRASEDLEIHNPIKEAISELEKALTGKLPEYKHPLSKKSTSSLSVLSKSSQSEESSSKIDLQRKRIDLAIRVLTERLTPLDRPKSLKDVNIGLQLLAANEHRFLTKKDTPQTETYRYIAEGFEIMASNKDDISSTFFEEVKHFFSFFLNGFTQLHPEARGKVSKLIKDVMKSHHLLNKFILFLLEHAGSNESSVIILLKMLRSKSLIKVQSLSTSIEKQTPIIALYNSLDLGTNDDLAEAMANYLFQIYEQQPDAFRAMIKEIDFFRVHKLSTSVQLRRLLEPFLKSKNPEAIKRLFSALNEVNALYYFCDATVVSGFERDFARTMDQFLSIKREPVKAMGSQLKKHYPANLFPYYHLLNLVFIFQAAQLLPRVKAERQDFFVRTVFHTSAGINQKRQKELVKEDVNSSLVGQLVDYTNKFNNFRVDIGKKEEIKKFIFDRLEIGARHLEPDEYEIAIELIIQVLRDLSGVDQRQVAEILRFPDSVGGYKSGLDAIGDLFQTLMKGENPRKWKMDSVIERVYYMYCYVKYPLRDYRNWINSVNGNNPYFPAEELTTILDGIEPYRERDSIIKQLPEIGYKFVQNSQLSTIIGAKQSIADDYHFFAKVGTGQGKSLIIANLALYYAQQGRKVVVFTCYEHLAKRDYSQFKDFYQKNGIESCVLSSLSDYEDKQRIVYADMDTFVSLFYDDVGSAIQGKSNMRHPLNDFDMAILDEFDSLVVDASKIGNIVTNFKSLFNFPGMASPVEARRYLQTDFKQEDALGPFFSGLDELGGSGIYSQWVSGMSAKEGRKATDYLGRPVNYVGGTLHELTQGRFHLYSSKLQILPYLLKFKHIIGLSGSIDKDGIDRLKDIFPKSENKKTKEEEVPIRYLQVAPFFGTNSEQRNRRVNTHEEAKRFWETHVKRDLEPVCKAERPILVFGDIEDPEEWSSLENLLREIAAEHDRKFQVITEESQTEDSSMYHACLSNYITLASHIVGRGADFKVHPEIKNKKISEEGLHVLIAYRPGGKKGDGDHRLMTQMTGRTARMEDLGTHSIILKDTKLPKPDKSSISIDEFETEFHELTRNTIYTLNQLKTSDNLQKMWKRWLILNNILISEKRWPSSVSSMEPLPRASAIFSKLIACGLPVELQRPEDAREQKRKALCNIL